jgi:HPt (histidine-containing phosphotransfer) domain-containing protein
MSDAIADFEGVLKRIGGDRELLVEVLLIFLDIAPGMMKELDAAVSGHDLERVLALAHDIRGAAANVGAGELVRQTSLMEMSARQGLFDHVREHYGLLVSEMQRVCTSTKTFLHP